MSLTRKEKFSCLIIFRFHSLYDFSSKHIQQQGFEKHKIAVADNMTSQNKNKMCSDDDGKYKTVVWIIIYSIEFSGNRASQHGYGYVFWTIIKNFEGIRSLYTWWHCQCSAWELFSYAFLGECFGVLKCNSLHLFHSYYPSTLDE